MATTLLLVGDSYSNQNLFYKTRFLCGDPFVYVERDGHRLLVTGEMERGRAQKESTVSEVRTFDDYGYRDLARELNDRIQAFIAVLTKIVRGFDSSGVVAEGSFPALYADQLRRDGISVDVDPRLLVAARRQKSDLEIAAIEEAQRAAERATSRALEVLTESGEQDGLLHFEGTPLTSDRLRAEIEVSLIYDGMESSSSPIVAGGPGAADPHWKGEGPLKYGEAMVLDIFPRSDRSRYHADMTRTVVKGDPGDRLRAMYDAVLSAQQAGLGAIRSGVNGRDVHQVVASVFEAHGFTDEAQGPRFVHGTGHGVGLAVHEAPHIGLLDEELQENEVVTVEPGLYDPAVGAVRIEDLVVVTRTGYRNLTQFPKRFEL